MRCATISSSKIRRGPTVRGRCANWRQLHAGHYLGNTSRYLDDVHRAELNVAVAQGRLSAARARLQREIDRIEELTAG